MNLKKTLKNIAKEFVALILVLVILVSFLVPVLTLWEGLFYDTVAFEFNCLELKTEMYYGLYLDGKEFKWDEEDTVINVD